MLTRVAKLIYFAYSQVNCDSYKLMNRETFESKYPGELTPRQYEVLPLFLEGLSDQVIAEKLFRTRTNITHHVRNTCRIFGIFPENDPDYRESLVKLFLQYMPTLVNDTLKEKYGYISKPRYPEGPEPLESVYYVERGIEHTCIKTLNEPGSLICIRGPKETGKTSLLKRLLAKCKNKNFHTAYINLSHFDPSTLIGDAIFLKQFYASAEQQLVDTEIENFSNDSIPAMNICTQQFQKLLEHLKGNLILGLDEADAIFNYPDIYQSFFPMVRHWRSDKINVSESWQKLRIIIAYSTEDYGRLDIHQSPFNIGTPVRLQSFTEIQTQKLALIHGIKQDDILKLHKFVEGHPYLVRLGLYHLANNNTSVNELLKKASSDSGIYKHHLIRNLENLKSCSDLSVLFEDLLSQSKSIEIRNKTFQLNQLEGMGLIKREGDFVQVRCELYRQYFRGRIY